MFRKMFLIREFNKDIKINTSQIRKSSSSSLINALVSIEKHPAQADNTYEIPSDLTYIVNSIVI